MAVIFWISLFFLIYVYLGYPLLMAVLAHFHRRGKSPSAELPEISLIIAAYNEELVLREKLANALELNYPREKMEIIVAADGSTDDTCDIVREFAPQGVKLSYSPERRGKLAAMAHAVESAAGEVLVFSDANNFFLPCSFQYLLQPFSDERVGASTGAKHVRSEEDSLSNSEGLYWKYESWIKKNESQLNSCTAAAGEILAVRKTLFPHIPAGVINDDFYILLSIIRAGYRIAYVPQAESWERVSQNQLDEVKRRTRITAGRFQALANSWRWLPWNNPTAVWQIISHKYFRLFIPFAMLLTLLSNLILAVAAWSGASQAGMWVNWMLAAQICFYALAGLGRYSAFKGPLKILYLPAFLVSSNLATLLGFFKHVRKNQDASWERVNRR
jgi:cellulose synthase/poly-beta-1,6-N-acetylglucosamine synthase-like glycosyltransferase